MENEIHNKNLPAFPPNGGWDHAYKNGITKREYYIAACLQGLLANPTTTIDTVENCIDIAISVTDMALDKL